MGRNRNEDTRRAILDAAVAELAERGYAALTVEGIAARAGAGKQTIYRWWPSKADVVLDAMLDLAAARIVDPDEGSLAADLTAFLGATFRRRGDQQRALAGLMAQSVLDPVFATSFRERFVFARRAALRAVLDRARARGELAPDVASDLLIDVVFGVLWYRLLVGHAPLDEQEGATLADLVVRAAGRAPTRLQPMVHVVDMAAAVAFFEHLGAAVRQGSRDGDWVLLAIGGTELGLLAHPPNPEQGEAQVELNLESAEALDALEVRLRAAGVTVLEPATKTFFGRQLQVATPDGLRVKINQLEPENYV